MIQIQKNKKSHTTFRRSCSQPSLTDGNYPVDHPQSIIRLRLRTHKSIPTPIFQTQRTITPNPFPTLQIHNKKSYPLIKRITSPQLKKRTINKYKQNCRIRSSQAINLLNSNITSNSWCLFDSSNNKYIGFRQSYKRQVASLTKIMTTMIAIQIVHKLALPLSCQIKVTSSALAMTGTLAYLKKDHWITFNDLLYGTMLPSGNDAAYCLAEYVGFCLYLQKTKSRTQNYCSYEIMDLSNDCTTSYVLEFIRHMNQKAFSLKLKDTHFCNPHGLPNAFNTSSAKDIVKLSAYCSKNQLFRKIINTKQYHYEMISKQETTTPSYRSQWHNTNKLLQRGWEGIKTGQTASAGNCLSSLKRGIYIVVLNCHNAEARFNDVQKIYKWYESQQEMRKQHNREDRSQVNRFVIQESLSTLDSL